MRPSQRWRLSTPAIGAKNIRRSRRAGDAIGSALFRSSPFRRPSGGSSTRRTPSRRSTQNYAAPCAREVIFQPMTRRRSSCFSSCARPLESGKCRRASGSRRRPNSPSCSTNASFKRDGATGPAHKIPDTPDLARAREAAGDDLRRKRQQLLSFLLRHSRIYSGGGHWTLAHRRWLAGQKFDHAAQQIVFQEGIDAIEDSLQRLRRVEKQLALVVPEWSMAPVVEAYQAMRGASFLVAVTFAAEIGDVRRFDTPRQLMSFLGLVPAESSTGDTIRRKGLTLAGNRRARRALVEAAGTYRYPARVSDTLRARLEGLPKPVRDIAWKAQVRLCARYRRLSATGKKLPIVVAAIAREMAAFLGYRSRGRAGIRGRSLLSAAQSRERRTKGGELPSLVMWPGSRPTPVL